MYLGLQVKQTSSCTCIEVHVDQHDYISEIQTVMIDRKRIKERKKTKESLNADEKQQSQSLTGQLN